jgi:methionine sulfoxide reductase heme-binding subunit
MAVAAARALPWYQRLRPGALYPLGLIPAAWTFWLGVTDRLGADPMKVLERDLGLWALKFLVLGLAITPPRRLTGVNLLRYRRAVGLLAFIYACLHLTTYLVLDQGLDLAAIWADILKRPYITVGMAAFLVLVPLAVTSNNAMVRRLGGPAWQRLHRWVYLAAAGAAVHYVMVAKTWQVEPLVYAGLVLLLLGYRLVVRLQQPARSDAGRLGGRPARATGRSRSAPQQAMLPVHRQMTHRVRPCNQSWM